MATANYHDLLHTQTLEYVCRETLNRTRDILEEDFDPLLVQHELLLNGILTETECEGVKCQSRRRDRLKLFLTVLETRHQMFHKFVDVLKNFNGYEALGRNLADQSLDLMSYVEEVKELWNRFGRNRSSEADQTYIIDALMDINKADAIKLLDYLKLNRHSIQLNNCNELGFRPTFAKILYENDISCFQFRKAFSALTESISICTTESSNDVEETDEPPFDFYDMMEYVIRELKLSSIENMCKYLKMSTSMRSIRNSETPGRQFFIECRRKNIISRYDTQRLVEAAHMCRLKRVEEIIKDYQRTARCPEIRVTLSCTSSSATACNDFIEFFLNKKRELKAMFRRNHGAHFVDSEEGSIVVRLKVSNVRELERLTEDIKSGKVLESVKELYQSEEPKKRMKNGSGKVVTAEISIDRTDISNAVEYFSYGSSISHSHSFSKSTETRTTTTVTTDFRQRALRSVMAELEEEFDPISLLPMLEEGEFFDEGEKDQLLRTSVRGDRVQLFQSYLLSKSRSKFNDFMNALSGCGHYRSLVKTLSRSLFEIEETEYIHRTFTSTEIRKESSSHRFSCETSANTARTDDVKLEAKSLETGCETSAKTAKTDDVKLEAKTLETGCETSANTAKTDDVKLEAKTLETDSEWYPYFPNGKRPANLKHGAVVKAHLQAKRACEDMFTRYSLPSNQNPDEIVDPSFTRYVVVIGNTGAGKSLAINTILDRNVRSVSNRLDSETMFSAYATGTYKGMKIRVIDTPGVHNNKQSESQVKEELTRAAFLMRNGVHCYIICINISNCRLSNKDVETLKLLKNNKHPINRQMENGQMDKWTDGQVNRWTHEQTDRWTDGLMNRWNDGQMER